MKRYPDNFEDCVAWAREKYEKYFVHDINQLLYTYPLDTKNDDGKLFWTMPKRPPMKKAFLSSEDLTFRYVASASYLNATGFGIFRGPRGDRRVSIEIGGSKSRFNLSVYGETGWWNQNQDSDQNLAPRGRLEEAVIAKLRSEEVMGMVSKFAESCPIKEFKISSEKAEKMTQALAQEKNPKGQPLVNKEYLGTPKSEPEGTADAKLSHLFHTPVDIGDLKLDAGKYSFEDLAKWQGGDFTKSLGIENTPIDNFFDTGEINNTDEQFIPKQIPLKMKFLSLNGGVNRHLLNSIDPKSLKNLEHDK
jgi:hypothetical protein